MLHGYIPRFTTNAAGRPLKALHTMCRFEVLEWIIPILKSTGKL